jgi:hypothetical protein
MVFDMPVLAAYCGPMLPASAPAQLPTRLQLVTGLLEWLLYSATALAAAVRMQGAGMSDLHLRALVAWPFMVIIIIIMLQPVHQWFPLHGLCLLWSKPLKNYEL